MDYDNTNSGVLFINDRKTTDRHPDWNGKLNVNGVEHWFSAWKKQGQKGPFLSVSIGKPVEEQRPAQPAPVSRPAPGRAPAKPLQDMDSDIPW